MENELTHWGVLGMKWGVRKGSTSSVFAHHPDHDAVVKVKTKGLRSMTDSEVKQAVKRMQLVKDYKESPFRIRKPIPSMSNKDLVTETARAKLQKLDWTEGVRKTKKIKDMSGEEVNQLLKRHNLEKTYRELRTSELAPIRRFVSGMIGLVDRYYSIRG